MAVPVNSALNTAIAALTAQPYPWFLPVYSIRLTDAAMYQTFVESYGFGTNVVIGLSPADAAIITGVQIVTDSSYGSQQVRPEIFVHPDALNVLGEPITINESGGTIAVSYANALGRYDRVVWQWQCEVVLFAEPVVNPEGGGKYEQAVVTWTGDGTLNRLIPTPFALDAGAVAIWGCGGANGNGSTQPNFFRHNGSQMGGTAAMGVVTAPVAGQGIIGFESGGFRVQDGAQPFPQANTLGVSYAAVVLKDTTFDQRYMRIGTYKNVVGGNFGANVTHGSQSIFFSSGSAWSPILSNLVVNDGVNDYVFTYISPTQASIFPAYSGLTGVAGFAFVGFLFPHPIAITPTLLAFTPTHVWVWGSVVFYKSTEFPGASSVTLINGPSGGPPANDLLTAFALNEFTIGSSGGNKPGQFNIEFDFLTLAAGAEFLSHHLFKSLSGTGAGAPPTVTGSIGFTPELVFGRQGGTVFTAGACARGPLHAGTDSTLCSNIGGNNNLPTTGITAIHADTVDLGIVPAPAGDPYYLWMFQSGEIIVSGSSTPGPPYNPIAIASGDYSPNGGLLVATGGLGVGHTGPCGCSLLE